MHKPTKLIDVIVLIFSFLIVGKISAQEVVTHQNLAADFYRGENDTAVILLHGTLAHNRMEIIKTLSTLISEDYGFSVLAPNLSLNDSDRMAKAILNSGKAYDQPFACSIEHNHTYFDALDELNVWVDYLKQEGFSKIVVGGHSRGGRQVSLYLADDKVDASVVGGFLIASGLGESETAEQEYKASTGLSLNTLVKKFTKLEPSAFVDVPLFLYCEEPKVTAGAFVTEYTNDPRQNAPYNVSKIRGIPILVIGGSEDQVVPNIENDFKDLQGQKNLSIQIIDGADHFFRDLYADDVAGLIADLIDGI